MSDALSQILDHLKLEGTIYFHTDFHKPWGIKVPAHANVIRFHMAMRGECYFRIEEVAEPVFVGHKDLIVIPNGVPHDIIDSVDGHAHEIEDVANATGFSDSGALRTGKGDDPRPCQLICGHFGFFEGADHPVLHALPRYLLLRNEQEVTTQWFEPAMRFMSSEILSQQPGNQAVIHRLAEVIFIHVIRSYAAGAGDNAGMLAALMDPKFGKCLSMVHSDPAQPWTVADMAKRVGMSRTSFAERFHKLVGMTPLGYVTYWRMQLARRKLLTTDASLADIAHLVGYGSEAAFNRAFKRAIGQTPGQMRRS